MLFIPVPEDEGLTGFILGMCFIQMNPDALFLYIIGAVGTEILFSTSSYGNNISSLLNCLRPRNVRAL